MIKEIISIIALGIGFSADAFAVAVCKGLGVEKIKKGQGVIVGVWFGLFQALMPLVGYFVAGGVIKYIEAFDHWVVFGLLLLIGTNMILEAFRVDEECLNASFGIKSMFPLAIATSIDALAGGVAFSVDGTNIWLAISFIGVITFILSWLGVHIGNKFGKKYKKTAEIIGGVILILIGVKALIEGLV